MINQVVPRSELMSAARALANDILACAPLSIEASKQVMVQSLDEANFEQAMRRRYQAADRMLISEDAREGPRAFAEKRKPRWQGC
jgi:enoyl-CoA hydratase/carnithine racemase